MKQLLIFAAVSISLTFILPEELKQYNKLINQASTSHHDFSTVGIVNLDSLPPNYHDNRELLDDVHVNPKFATLVKRFIDTARTLGFFPVVHEAFRTQAKATQLSKENKLRPAAKVSVHSFGFAVDIWLSNKKGDIFSYDAKEYKANKSYRFSYATWLQFIRIGQKLGLINAYMHDDTDHWEFHPKWSTDDWVSANKMAIPIYEKYRDYSELDRLRQVWIAAGLE